MYAQMRSVDALVHFIYSIVLALKPLCGTGTAWQQRPNSNPRRCAERTMRGGVLRNTGGYDRPGGAVFVISCVRTFA